MNDCINAEIRDLLPDLVHDRLSAADQTSVLAHVGGCADCRDELQLLRDAKALFARGVPRVDVAYVVGAQPKARAPRLTTDRITPTRAHRWNDWRIAAAVTLLIAGGGSYALLGTHRAGAASDMVDTVVAMAEIAPVAVPTMGADATLDSALSLAPDLASMVAPDDDQPSAIGSMDARLGDLTEDQLNVLLNDIDNLRALPATEPEPMSIGQDAKTSLEDM